jgi:hypothetical protein
VIAGIAGSQPFQMRMTPVANEAASDAARTVQ